MSNILLIIFFMNKTLYVFFILFLLSSCWADTIDNNNQTTTDNKEMVQDWVSDIDNDILASKKKTNFIIETNNLNDFDSSYKMEKSSKIVWTQIIDIKTQSSWDINKIFVKEWDNVVVWQLLANLKDNYNSKFLSLEKAKISLEKAKISYDSKVISIEKSISDAKLNLSKIENDLKIEKNKLEQDLNKAKLDYSNSLIWDNNTINDYVDDVNKEYIDFKSSLYDIIDFSDKILWVTDYNKDENNSFENYLWAKNTNLKSLTEQNLKDLIIFNDNLKTLDTSLDKNNILPFISELENGYNIIIVLLDNLEETINSSVVSSNLTQSIIDSYINSINWKQSSNLSKFSWYITLKWKINSFLNTYKESDNNFDNSSKLLDWTTDNEIIYNKSILNIKDSINSLENQLESARLSLQNALDNKPISLQSAQNDIDSAENSYKQSQAEYSKLSIKSPINGVVWEVNIDELSYVWNNTSLLTLVWNKNTELELSLSKDELFWINISDEVEVIYNWVSFNWKVYSIWSIADSNLNFKVKIIITDDIKLTWWVATVVFKINLDGFTILPIDTVSVIWWNIWTINIFMDWKLKELKVSLWKVYNNMIEIKGKYNSENIVVPFEWNPEIILTDLRKFNADKNILIKEENIDSVIIKNEKTQK